MGFSQRIQEKIKSPYPISLQLLQARSYFPCWALQTGFTIPLRGELDLDSGHPGLARGFYPEALVTPGLPGDYLAEMANHDSTRRPLA